LTFDSAKSKLTRNNFAVGYRTGDFQLHTNVNDGTEFGGSIYQKVCEDLDTSVNLAWTSGTNSTRFGIAAKYQLDPTASISVSTTVGLEWGLRLWEFHLWVYCAENLNCGSHNP